MSDSGKARRIVVDIDPMGKPRMTRSDRWTNKEKGVGRPAVLRYFNWQDELLLRMPDYEVPAEFKITFYMPFPKSYSKKKRESLLGKPHKEKPDIDNLQKAFLDTLCEEDSYVWHVDASKVWSDKGQIVIIESEGK